MNKYTKFDSHLQDVSRILSIDNNRKTKHVNSFIEVFGAIKELIQDSDPLFLNYKDVKFSGSYANNIKIVTPDEFDVMLCMKLPNELELDILNCGYPAHVQLKAKNLEFFKKTPQWRTYKSLGLWMDNKHFILQTKFRQWFEGNLIKILNQQKNSITGIPTLTFGDKGSYKLSLKKSKPAFTLNVTKLSDEGIHFDIDIVPCFSFEFPTWPSIVKIKYALMSEIKEWFVIAKPVETDDSFKRHRCWRIVFPGQEQRLLSHHNNMKIVLKLLKRFRDIHRLPYIKSYFINTIFMWEVKTSNQNYWLNNTGFLFVDMLRKLHERIRSGEILYFWDNRLNLLEKVTKNQMKDADVKLKNCLNDLEDHYEHFPGIIKIKLDVPLTDRKWWVGSNNPDNAMSAKYATVASKVRLPCSNTKKSSIIQL